MGNGNIIRIHKNENYTHISNFHLKEKGMSLKAKGLLTLMLSLPPNWNYSIEGLASLNKDNRDSIKSALEELNQFGYFHREITNKGKFTSIYHVYEEPHLEGIMDEIIEPERITRDGFSATENPSQLNTNNSNNIVNINKEVNTISKVNNIKDLKQFKKDKQYTLTDKVYLYTKNPEIQKALFDFLEMYKQKFKSYPALISFDKILEQLRTLAGTDAKLALKIINTSTLKGYREFFALSDNQNNSGYVLNGPGYIHTEQKKANPEDIVDVEY